jgi:hypothetical protein
MFSRVKKGDRILIPHLPQYGQITIAEATEDWDKGYDFSVWEKSGDHGHIFPAKSLSIFGAATWEYQLRLSEPSEIHPVSGK